MATANLEHTLNALLSEAERFGPTYGNGLSNHLPMVLIALQRLGASAAELEAHMERYERRLEPVLASAMVINKEKPAAHLGDWSAFSAYRVFFEDALTRDATQKALATHWPMLMPGIAAAGFHALIRLAYGLEAQHRGEIASGLAYMASSFTPLFSDTAELPAKAASVANALEPMHKAFVGRTIVANLIIEELQLASEEPDFFAALRTPPLGSKEERERTLGEMAHMAIRIYLAKPNFNSLHLVTGTHALSVLLPHLAEGMHAETIFYFWVAFCAGYVTIGAPEAIEPESVTTDNWSVITDAVRRGGNDHDIKLVYSCKAEYQKSRDPAYLTAAARLVRGASA